jgi:hypothetical protein
MAGVLRDVAEGRGGWYRARRAHTGSRMPAALAAHAAAWRAWITGTDDAIVHMASVADDVGRIRRALRVALLPLQRQASVYARPS